MVLPTPEKMAASPGFSSKPKAKKANIWLIVSIVLAVVLVGVLVATLVKMPGSGKMTVISQDKAASSLIGFINEVYADRIGLATLKTVSEESGLYKVDLTINPPSETGTAAAPVDQTVYVTKDGKLFIPQAMVISDLLSQFQAYQQQQQAAGIGTAEVQLQPGDIGTDEAQPAPDIDADMQ